MLDRLKLGGQDYVIDGRRVPVVLDVSHTTSGWSLRLRFDVKLAGPCMRCLEPAARVVSIDSREVDQPGGGDDLRSPYVGGGSARRACVGARRAGTGPSR